MPLLYDDVNPLSDIQFNKTDTKMYLSQPYGNIKLAGHKLPDGYRFVKHVRTGEFRLIKDGTTFFRYVTTTNGLCHKLVHAHAEEDVWYNINFHDVLYPVLRAFFYQMFYQYGHMLPDWTQTKEHRLFWIDRIREIYTKGHFVYVLAAEPNDYYTYTSIPSYDEFAAQWVDYCWGDVGEIYQRRTLLVTVDPLMDIRKDEP